MSYFLDLIKGNIVLFTIFSTANFSNVDLKGYDHQFLSDKVLRINNFSFNDSIKFKYVDIVLNPELGPSLSFLTDDPKYYDKPEVYFNVKGDERIKRPRELNGQIVNRSRKQLGEFTDWGKAIRVTILKSDIYGYDINIRYPIK